MNKDEQRYGEPVIVANVVRAITALEAQAAASLFLSDNLGDRFLASSPTLDAAAKVWRVPPLGGFTKKIVMPSKPPLIERSDQDASGVIRSWTCHKHIPGRKSLISDWPVS